MSRYDLYGSAVLDGRCPFCNENLRSRGDRSCPECGKKVGGRYGRKRMQFLANQILSRGCRAG
jgi:hypothetical protein